MISQRYANFLNMQEFAKKNCKFVFEMSEKEITQRRWALLTGASKGIGLELAKGLIHRGYDLVVVARGAEGLERARLSLKEAGAGEVVTIGLDLSLQGAALRLYEECIRRGIEVELLVNNAGMFAYLDLTAFTEQRVEDMVRLHVLNLTELCRLFARDMCARGRGYILNLSSYASWLPLAGLGLYGATKAYIREFSYALHDELRDCGVVVTVVMPAGVATELYGLKERYRRVGVRLGLLESPRRVAHRSLRGLFAGRRSVGPGVVWRVLLPLVRHLPRWAKKVVRQKTLGFQK